MLMIEIGRRKRGGHEVWEVHDGNLVLGWFNSEEAAREFMVNESKKKDGCYWVIKKNDDGTTEGHRWLIADRITQNNGFIKWTVLYDSEMYNDFTVKTVYRIGSIINPPHPE